MSLKRVAVGYWLDGCCLWGCRVSVLLLGGLGSIASSVAVGTVCGLMDIFCGADREKSFLEL